MKNFKIKESKNGYFYIKEKIEILSFEYTYFQTWLKFLLGIKKMFWRRDYYYQFKTYEEAFNFIKDK